jgi:hypothetical protein
MGLARNFSSAAIKRHLGGQRFPKMESAILIL